MQPRNYEAYQMIYTLTGKLNNYRDEVDDECQHCYDFVVRIKEGLGVEHSVPLLGKCCSR